MEKTITYSAFLISFSILITGSIMIINGADTTEFFYNFASLLFLIATLGFITVGIALVMHATRPLK